MRRTQYLAAALTASVAAALIAASCASGGGYAGAEYADARGDTCLMRGAVNGWTVPDSEHMIVSGRTRSERYELTMLGRCNGLQFPEELAFDTLGPSQCIQPGDRVSFRTGGGSRSWCSIADIQRIPPG